MPGKEQETKQTRKAQNKGTINREGKHEESDRERETENEKHVAGTIVCCVLFLAASIVGARV